MVFFISDTFAAGDELGAGGLAVRLGFAVVSESRENQELLSARSVPGAAAVSSAIKARPPAMRSALRFI
jgi:hypothetical protein